MARKLKMTKKCIAARRRYRAKKRGAGNLRKRPADDFGLGIKHRYVTQGKKRRPLKRRAMSVGSGLRKRRRRRGRGRGRGPRGAGFWEDLGKSFEWVGDAALTVLPFIAAVL